MAQPRAHTFPSNSDARESYTFPYPHSTSTCLRSTTVRIYEHRTIHRRRHFTQSARVKIHSRCFFHNVHIPKSICVGPFPKSTGGAIRIHHCYFAALAVACSARQRRRAGGCQPHCTCRRPPWCGEVDSTFEIAGPRCCASCWTISCVRLWGGTTTRGPIHQTPCVWGNI